MKRARLLLILAALSCSEPTANHQRPGSSSGVEQSHESYSYSIRPNRTVYVAFTTVRNENGEPIHAFMRRMFASADSVGAVRLVIDLGSLTGSDARLLVPLIKGVAKRESFARPGGLYVIVGPDSFSPVQNAATLLRQHANPIFFQGRSYR